MEVDRLPLSDGLTKATPAACYIGFMRIQLSLASALLLLVSGCGKDLEGQLQEQVRTLGNAALKPEQVEITSIRSSGDDAVAEITIKTAVKMRKQGNEWVLDEVSLGGGRWEKVDRILRAVNQERGDETQRQMEAVRDGIARYRSREGEVPQVRNYVALIDVLAPGDLSTVIRLDSWGNQFFYRAFSVDSYEIRSTGPDALVYTDDDLVVKG